MLNIQNKLENKFLLEVYRYINIKLGNRLSSIQKLNKISLSFLELLYNYFCKI